jgi:putative nucleotidyltransferase with HDIG domain
MADGSPPPRVRPAALTRLIAGVSVAGIAVIGYSLWTLAATPHAAGWIAVGVLALVAGSFALKVPGTSAHLSISDTFFITSALLFGPAPAAVTIALDSLLISWKRRHKIDQLLFNLTGPACSLWLATQTFFALAQSGPLYDSQMPGEWRLITALGCLAVVYFGLNSGLLSAAIAFDKALSPLHVWRQHFTVISLNYFASASAAFVLVVLVTYMSIAAVAALAPVLIIFYLAMRSWLGRLEDADAHVAQVNRLHLSTVSALSTAIEAKDGVTSDHIHRVQAYALGLARALHITDAATMRAIEAAALLHDTGKLAVPEHILNKPGRLTPAEFETMKTHVDVGADILSSIEFPYPVVPIVRAHHENWDGSGYPRGLRGEDIPVGARILSVVDCFDALTSDRPYRSAMSEHDALQIIVERRGSMYDPHIVDTFLRVYRDIAPPAQPQPGLQNALGRIRRASASAVQPVTPAAGAISPAPRDGESPSAPASPSPDCSEEVLAFVSLARVATHTPTVRDVGALAWGHLRHLAPGATLALYVRDGARDALVAQYTAGPAATRISGLTIGVSERVSGWVAANHRPMLNAEAQLDLGDAAEDLKCAVAMPLMAAHGLAGVMALYAPAPFSDDRARRLEMIAPHLATSLAAATQEAPRQSRPELRVVSSR